MIASSPRTAYCTFRRAGLSESMVSGRIFGGEVVKERSEREREKAFIIIDGLVIIRGYGVTTTPCQKKKIGLNWIGLEGGL